MSEHVSDLWSKSTVQMSGLYKWGTSVTLHQQCASQLVFPQYAYFPVCVYITVYLIVHGVTAPGQTKPFRSMFTPKLKATEAVSLGASLSIRLSIYDTWQCNPILATVGSGFMY